MAFLEKCTWTYFKVRRGTNGLKWEKQRERESTYTYIANPVILMNSSFCASRNQNRRKKCGEQNDPLLSSKRNRNLRLFYVRKCQSMEKKIVFLCETSGGQLEPTSSWRLWSRRQRPWRRITEPSSSSFLSKLLPCIKHRLRTLARL
jgi:hypothetical protein